MAIAARVNLNIPENSIPSAAINGPIDDGKLEHQIPITYQQSTAAIVASETLSIYTAYAGGNIKAVKIKVGTKPASGSYTVDVKKAATGSNTYTTILSAVETISSADADGGNYEPTLTTTTYAEDDTFQVVIAATTPTGSAGVSVTVLLDQLPSP